MSDLSTIYKGCRSRVCELVLPPDAGAAQRTVQQIAQTPVPTCPQWSVQDVLAHVIGSATDLVAGRLDGAPGEEWTAAQVESRRSCSTSDLIAEWEACAPAIEKLIDEGGHRGPLHFSLEDAIICDAVSHEYDIRGALGQPGARDCDAVTFAVVFYARNRVEAMAKRGLSLRVCLTDGGEFGEPDAAVTLTGDPFELLRAMAGRRSLSQLRELAWTGDIEPVIANFGRPGALNPPPYPVEE
jgi:uncharacterized protein (TIGR03083 family)